MWIRTSQSLPSSCICPPTKSQSVRIFNELVLWSTMSNTQKTASGLGCNQFIIYIGLLASIIGIFTFVSGIMKLEDLLRLVGINNSPTTSAQITTPVTNQLPTPVTSVNDSSQISTPSGSLAPTPTMAPSNLQAIGPFIENFKASGLDTSRWTRENSGGEVNAGGSLKLSSSTGTFPYIHSTGQVFPTDGNFQFEVRFRYPNPDACGVGILLTTYNTPVGLSQSQTEIVQHENEMNGFTTGVWQDATTGMHIWFRSAADVVEKPVYGSKSNSDWHLLTIAYSDSKYSIFLDKDNNPSPVYESPMMLYHPEFITFGHPAVITTCAGHWTNLEVESISVKPQ